jgi:Resolvase, N terminal domain/Helix-turn-helix domain of resolvase
VFREVASGAKTDRAQLRRLLGQLEAGDVVTVTRLDRLARSTRDLLNTLATITGKKAGFRSLGDAWADTTTSHGRLMLTVLGGLAEFERDLIRVRTGEGRERAKARGVKMGRKPKLTPHQQREAMKRRDRGEPVREIARSFNVRFCQLSCPGIGTGVSPVLPFRLPPGFRALPPCDACGEGAASLPEHVGTCGTGSGESLGVRRALGNIVLLMRCS